MLPMWLKWRASLPILGKALLGALLLSATSAFSADTSRWLGVSERDAYRAFEAQKFDEAEKLYRKKFEQNPNDPKAAFNLGAAQLRKGDLDSALQSFKRAEQSLDPALKADAFYNEAAAHYLKGNKQDTASALKEALSYAPEHGPAKALQQKLAEQKPEQKQQQAENNKQNQDQNKQQNQSQPHEQQGQQQQNQSQNQQNQQGDHQQNKDQEGKEQKPAEGQQKQQGQDDKMKDAQGQNDKQPGQQTEQQQQKADGKKPGEMPQAQTMKQTQGKDEKGKPTAAMREAEKTLRKVDDKVMRYLWEAPGGKGKSQQQEEHPW